jgi:hypothetical protein
LILPVVAVVSSVQDTATVSAAVTKVASILDTSALIVKVFVVSLAIVQVKSVKATVITPSSPASAAVLALANTVVPSTILTVGMAATVLASVVNVPPPVKIYSNLVILTSFPVALKSNLANSTSEVVSNALSKTAFSTLAVLADIVTVPAVLATMLIVLEGAALVPTAAAGAYWVKPRPSVPRTALAPKNIPVSTPSPASGVTGTETLIVKVFVVSLAIAIDNPVKAYL